MTDNNNNQQDDIHLIKAYNNYEFLNSPPARIIRVMAEMIEPSTRLRKYNTWNTVVFFGSARILPQKEAFKKLSEIKQKLKDGNGNSEELKLAQKLAQRDVTMSRYYEDAVKLSQKLTIWFKELEQKDKRFMVCTGGGPGIMEAANLGAKKADGNSIGLNISLPWEQYPNIYQTKDLAIEFHYFFIRKFWFFYLAKALVVFPGGFGTLDEFFELLTIIQTGKSKKYMPVVLYGSEYWNKVINIEEMYNWGTISKEDLELYRIFDDVEETFEYLQQELTQHYVNDSRINL